MLGRFILTHPVYMENFLYVLQGSRQDQEKKLLTSCTLYIGNLSFYTTEEQIHELFNRAGDIKRIIMGLDKLQKTPCGFCFVEYPLSNHCFVIVYNNNGHKVYIVWLNLWYVGCQFQKY